ncbi:MAG: pyridoxamine 5'-phosphate oxidase [Gammaproteobacteria bacterium]|nr:pyridoxamine 5'-phosphate oxidase [Gammaproteobacteria bacterium]
MDDAEVDAFLRSNKTMILVSNGHNGHPHPMPMWFGIEDGGTIVMTTFRKSQKVNNIRNDPRVTLLVEAGLEYNELKSVMIYANAEVIDDLTETTNVMLGLAKGRGEVSDAQMEAARANMEKTASKRVVLKMTPTTVVSWDHSKLGGKY